jgi:hypothetical protein
MFEKLHVTFGTAVTPRPSRYTSGTVFQPHCDTDAQRPYLIHRLSLELEGASTKHGPAAVLRNME